MAFACEQTREIMVLKKIQKKYLVYPASNYFSDGITLGQARIRYSISKFGYNTNLEHAYIYGIAGQHIGRKL